MKVAGTASSAHAMHVMGLAPPPTALVAAACAGKMLNGSAPAAASGRLMRPALSAGFAHWRLDWQGEVRAAPGQGQRMLREEKHVRDEAHRDEIDRLKAAMATEQRASAQREPLHAARTPTPALPRRAASPTPCLPLPGPCPSLPPLFLPLLPLVPL